jgi:hypothetical protein
MQIPWLRSSYGYFPNLSCLWNIFVDFKSSTRIIGFILRDTTKSFFFVWNPQLLRQEKL